MKKIFSKFSITKKIFLIFFFIFLLFLFIWMIGQFFLFGEFYAYTKAKDVSEYIDQFSEEYTKLENADDINYAIVNYSNSSDAYYAVISENGEMLYMVSYELIIAPDNGGENLKFSLDNAVHNEDFMNNKLSVNDTVTVTYSSIGDDQQRANIYMPISIKHDGYVWETDYKFHSPRFVPQPGQEPDFDTNNGRSTFNTLSVSGTIVSITLPSPQASKLTVQRNDAAMVIMDWSEKLYNGVTVDLNDKYSYTVYPPDRDDQYSVTVKKIEKSGNIEYICAILPMRNISEAIDAVKDFSLFVFAVMFVLMAIIALIFSRAITHPIIEINSITEKMKQLDFSKKCRVKSSDELGMLSENVNEMSQRLDLTIKELIDANDKLIKDIEHERLLEKQRKEFVAAVSHELKTPLAIIRAYSEGLLDGVSQSKQERYLNIIVDETKNMDHLILDMLENSRLESGAMELNKKQYDMRILVNKIADRFKTPCKAEGIELICAVCDTPVIKSFDAELIEQVINNFMSNAMKNTQNGKIIISLTEKELSVENEGKHIPEEDLDKIWDRFYKIDKSRKRNGSTGLGLSISKNILILHNADYYVKNTDPGVKFGFSLP